MSKYSKSLLTLPNIQYLVEGLDVLLHTDLDGDKRTKVSDRQRARRRTIELRDHLVATTQRLSSNHPKVAPEK